MFRLHLRRMPDAVPRLLARASVLVGLALTVALIAAPAQAAPGDLDPSFGSGGEVTTSFAEDSAAQAVVVQPDGKIVVAGWTRISGTPTFALTRYNVDGTLDGDFGSGGRVLTDFGGFSLANAVALQPDGKIVAAGFVAGTISGFALARYNADGSLDATFGDAGTVTADFGVSNGGVEAFSVLIQSDGKIVAAGGAESGGGLFAKRFAVARFNPDGSLDATFGSDGKVTTDFGGLDEVGRAATLQPDGKIIEVGFTEGSNSPPQEGPRDFALVRFNSDGTLDNTFGNDGKVTTQFDGPADAWAVAVQPDDEIVVGGSAALPTGSSRFALARYEPDGILDSGFGTGGKVVADLGHPSLGRSLTLAANGEIIEAGLSVTPSFSGDFALARFSPDGSPDSTFGAGGEVTTDFAGGSDGAFAVTLQADGKVVAAGVTVPPTGPAEFALARYIGFQIDLTAPAISVPEPITTNATSPSGATVTYVVTATDPDDAVASLVCSPSSGSLFPIGTTTVICNASDTHGNTSSASFTVHVEGGGEQLVDLLAAVSHVGPGTSLADKIRRVQSYLAANDLAEACSTVTAFINEVQALSGKLIPVDQAVTLTASARRISAVLGC